MTVRKVVGYMDKVDFDEELGAAKGGNKVYPTVKNLQDACPCTKECGIVEVEVRFRKVVQPENFDFSKAKPLKDWTAKEKANSKRKARRHGMKRIALDMQRFTNNQKLQILGMALRMAVKKKGRKSG